MNRKYLIAGNWKMNLTSDEAAELVREIVQNVGQQMDVEVVVCPPFTALSRVAPLLEGGTVKLGAQNMHPAVSGAFTGEISAEMLRSHFASYVILGHSERRSLFGETDTFVNEKVHAAIKNQLKPILCVGESLAEREAGATLGVIERQLEGGLRDIDGEATAGIVVAYEPVWAIGTGKVATPEQAQKVHAFIRGWLENRYDKSASQKMRLLYGGSMKPSNARELLAQMDIDGGLIGGAALEANSFVDLVTAAREQG